MSELTFPADEALTEERAPVLAAELGLAPDEYERIVETLDRVPSTSELGMYSVMWSEHCSYKSSKVHLRNLPTEGPQVLVGPGENAGVVDVGDGIAVTFKIESHNHPSFVEPYQGAATGVGGILRDIFTMGARPIAVMNPLRFGMPTGEGAALQRRLVDGVVRGISGYGNCVGVPNIGGEVEFDDCYAGNPLVNVLAIGVMKQERLQLAKAEAVGDVAILLGSATGRDGIGGASVLASQEFDEGLQDKRPNVQVGDPFAEKLLIECCLELYERDLVNGIQDMGAAGIACSSSELASKASMGMKVDLDKVHLREPSMESWEILCSESQERMLALVNPSKVDEVLALAEKWGVPASVVGEVIEGDDLVLTRRGEVVAVCPARSLADEGPTYHRPMSRPGWLDDYAAIDAEAVELPDGASELRDFVLGFFRSPNVGSRRWIWEQYDHLVLGGTVFGPGRADAGVVRLPESRKAVACSTDGNGLWCELDPFEGAKRVVAESYRNVACTGAKPLATTNCLNFGNPERPEIMWQLAKSIEGIGVACGELDVPITGGNVSLYNETKGGAIHPTPVIGVLGVLNDAELAVDIAFKQAGHSVLQLGAVNQPGLAASELRRHLGLPMGGTLAPVDLDLERRLGGFLHAAAADRLLASANDISSGGLVTSLVESCLAGGIGFAGQVPLDLGVGQALFGEAPGRVLVSVAEEDRAEVVRRAMDADLTIVELGRTTDDGIVAIEEVVEVSLADLRAAHEDALPDAVDPRGD